MHIQRSDGALAKAMDYFLLPDDSKCCVSAPYP